MHGLETLPEFQGLNSGGAASPSPVVGRLRSETNGESAKGKRSRHAEEKPADAHTGSEGQGHTRPGTPTGCDVMVCGPLPNAYHPISAREHHRDLLQTGADPTGRWPPARRDRGTIPDRRPQMPRGSCSDRDRRTRWENVTLEPRRLWAPHVDRCPRRRALTSGEVGPRA